jgi:hypothetical protein
VELAAISARVLQATDWSAGLLGRFHISGVSEHTLCQGAVLVLRAVCFDDFGLCVVSLVRLLLTVETHYVRVLA